MTALAFVDHLPSAPSFINADNKIVKAVLVFLLSFGTTYLLIFIFRFLLVSPFLVWEKEKKRADALAEKIRPKLNIIFDPDDPGCIHQAPYNDDRRSARLFCIKIENCGLDSIANCGANLMSISQADGDNVLVQSLELKMSPPYHNNAFRGEIRNKVPALANIVSVTSDNAVDIWANMPTYLAKNNPFLKQGTFKLHIVVSASEVIPVSIELLFGWTGDWQTATMVQC